MNIIDRQFLCWVFSTFDIVENDFEDFKEIPVSRSMLLDHTPDAYYSQVRQIQEYRLREQEREDRENPREEP
jgi:hypothetical protein